MKMTCRLLMLALFIEIVLHSTTTFSFQETFLLEGRRVKRDQCQYGVYDYNGEQCCKCPLGHYVKTHCGKGAVTTCEQCQEDTYYEKPNSGMECERCRSCNANLYQETDGKCTKIQNSKCRCMEGYWGVCQDSCQCHLCDKCDGRSILAHCTSTNNTRCEEPIGDSHQTWNIQTIVIILVLVLVLVFVVVLLYFLKKRKVCFSGVEEKGLVELTKLQPIPIMPAVDLSNHLYDIVDELGPQLVKELAIGSGIREAQIEMHIDEHPRNTREQCYSILKDWNEKKGLNQAFPELMKFLQKSGKNANAERLNNLIMQKTEDAACVNMDNPEQPA